MKNEKLPINLKTFGLEINFLAKFAFLIAFMWQFGTINAQVVINEIYPDMDRVELKNIGTTTIDVSTYWFCDRPTYARLNNSGLVTVISGSLNMAPDDITVLSFSYFSGSNNTRGELALYNNNTFGSSSAMLDYVKWGNKPTSTRESIAVAAGIWTMGDTSASFVTSESLQYDGAGDASTDWFTNSDTLGAENTASTPSEPRLVNVDSASDMVTITNLGDDSIDLTNYWLCLGPGTYVRVGTITPTSGAYILANGESVVLGYTLPDVNGGVSLFSTNSFGSSDPTILKDYMQYGAANQPRVVQAVTAGRWDNAANFVGDSSPYNFTGASGDVGSTFWTGCATVAGEITFDTAGISSTTSISTDGTSAVICVDGNADPLGVTVAAGSVGTNSGWIITNAATDEILALPSAPPFNLDGAGIGTCEIWYVRYESDFSGNVVGNNLSDLAGCYDLSVPIEVIREEAYGGTVSIDLAATGNPNNTTSFNSATEAVICVDGNADPLVVVHNNPGAENLSYRYVITNDDSSLILAISPSSSIDLDGAGAGTCRIWGWSYRGLAGGAAFIGLPLSDLQAEDCSDISSNSIRVIREEADGGTVSIDLAATGNPNNTTSFNSATEAVICVDGNADPLVVVHSNPGAENLSYRYVITNDDSSLILAISPSSSIDLDGAGAGTCRIWGWSYRGLADNGASFIGSPLADLQAVDCSDISDNSIRVIREEAHGGTVSIDLAATGNPNNTTSFNSATEAVICVDGNADPLVVVHVNDSPNLTYQYVITNDDSSEILAISPSSSINLDGAGAGTCRIWGWSYRGLADNGASFIGSPLADLQAVACSDISDNSIRVIREEADGGTVSIDLAATGNPNNTTSFNGDTEAVICVDGNADPLVVVHSNPGAENLSYRYVITNDDSSLILAISPSSSIDLDGAGAGTCRIWGWSYRGLADNGASFIGSPLADLQAEDCSDISSNSIRVIREEADGGTVSIDLAATGNPNNTTSFNSATEAVICVDGNADPLVVVHNNPGAENLSYRYVITNDDSSLILAISPSSSIDLDGAGAGTCRIWGWSYRGLADNGASFIGSPLADLQAVDCSDISDNSIRVIREEAHGGTVSLSSGDNAISICAGDGIPNPLLVTHVNNSPNLTYQYVITNDDSSEILAISSSSTIDLDGAGAGTCRIWGWSYRGLAGGAAFIGLPLSDLQAEDCSDISSNSIVVSRFTGTDCDSLSVGDFDTSFSVNVFPNPTEDILNIKFNSNIQLSEFIVEVYSISGQRVFRSVLQNSQNDATIDLSSLNSGFYLMNIIDNERGLSVTKKIAKK